MQSSVTFLSPVTLHFSVMALSQKLTAADRFDINFLESFLKRWTGFNSNIYCALVGSYNKLHGLEVESISGSCSFSWTHYWVMREGIMCFEVLWFSSQIAEVIDRPPAFYFHKYYLLWIKIPLHSPWLLSCVPRHEVEKWSCREGGTSGGSWALSLCKMESKHK